jgi:lipopolysaccharide/colanic/teichoic acid biosynthesis glycosyltransferase
MKHAADRLLAAVGLVLLAPVLMLVAVAVRVDSRGPVIFRQERVGREGRLFRIWKFRTMRNGADAELRRLLEVHDRSDAPLFKVPDDPRVTRLGRFLRKYSLDELPQLWNVLRGEMSLVGPRPQRPAEVALYSPREELRLVMKPGLTGLWQVNGRSDLEWELAVKFDLKYVRAWNLKMDFAIGVQTVGAVLRGSGAQ